MTSTLSIVSTAAQSFEPVKMSYCQELNEAQLKDFTVKRGKR